MKDEQHLALEAIKLIKEWSSWVVALEVGTLGFVGLNNFRQMSQGTLFIALIAFFLSTFAAAFVLSAIPWITLNLDLKEFKNPYTSRITSVECLNWIRLWHMCCIQQFTFFVGMGMLFLNLLLR